MEDKKISQETNGAPAQGTDEFRIRRGNANFKLTLSNVLAYIVNLLTHLATIIGIQKSQYTWAKDTGTENTIYVTLSPRFAPEEQGVLPDGMKIGVRAKYGNTISDPLLGMNCSIIGELGYSISFPIVKWGNQPLSPGDYTANMECLFRFNADIQKWELMNPKGSNSIERRHDWQVPYDYCGTASIGTAETTSTWTITRITVADDGSTTSSILYNVKWSDHLILNYEV